MKVEVVGASQEINPAVTKRADDFFGTPAQLVLHEVTEAYQAAHAAAVPQSGKIRSRFVDRFGGETPGNLPGVIYGLQFLAVDKIGREKVIMEK